eukprot:4442676-Amphidinium_carterae.1
MVYEEGIKLYGPQDEGAISPKGMVCPFERSSVLIQCYEEQLSLLTQNSPAPKNKQQLPQGPTTQRKFYSPQTNLKVKTN